MTPQFNMTTFYYFWTLFVIFFSTWLPAHAQGPDSETITGAPDNWELICNNTTALDICWHKLPAPENGNATLLDTVAVRSSCLKNLQSGFSCVGNWSSICLSSQDRDKVGNSVLGIVTAYEFLCANEQYHDQFLLHAECYKNISLYWDNCSNNYTDNLRRANNRTNSLFFYCNAINYLECLSNVGSKHCSSNSTQFLHQLVKTVAFSMLQNYGLARVKCGSLNAQNCTAFNFNSVQMPTDEFNSGSAATYYSYSMYWLLNFNLVKRFIIF